MRTQFKIAHRRRFAYRSIFPHGSKFTHVNTCIWRIQTGHRILGMLGVNAIMQDKIFRNKLLRNKVSSLHAPYQNGVV